jgi:hypothetical protein
MRSADYVQETTTSIAGTSGNGAITLTAIAGSPRLSTVFGAQATTVRYVIEDTTLNKFESGIGSVAANVLTRVRPQVTWDGTTWTDGSASAVAALAFGSTPAAGNVVVRLAATAEVQGIVIPQIQTQFGGDAWRDYPTCANYMGVGAGNAMAVNANQIYHHLYKLDRAGNVNGIQLSVGTAGGTNLKLALYSLGYNGLPDKKIVDFNLISSATTGVKTDTATGTWTPAGPVYLTPAWYVIAWIADAAIQLDGNWSGSTRRGRTPFGVNGGYGDSQVITVPATYASGLPAVASMTGGALDTGNGCFRVGLKVVA